MAKTTQPPRKYRMPDAELKQVADNLLLFIERDAAEFAQWGYSPTKRQEFVAKIEEFISVDADETLEGQRMTATEVREAAREQLEQLLRIIQLKAKLVLGAGSGRLREFGEGNVSALNDNDLIRVARIVRRAADKYTSLLSSVGLSPAHASMLADATQALDTAVDGHWQANINRDAATHHRIEVGNELYELINRYTEIGKAIWYATNEAKYNDYVIYRASEKKAPASKKKDEAADE